MNVQQKANNLLATTQRVFSLTEDFNQYKPTRFTAEASDLRYPLGNSILVEHGGVIKRFYLELTKVDADGDTQYMLYTSPESPVTIKIFND